MNPWDKTTPIEAIQPEEESQLSNRGYFWIGCAVGVVWTLVMGAAVALLRHFIF